MLAIAKAAKQRVAIAAIDLGTGRARRRRMRCDSCSLEGSGGDVAQGIDDAVDDFLDQQAVFAFAHHPDHRLGAR
jgi:hypothetical protein